MRLRRQVASLTNERFPEHAYRATIITIIQRKVAWFSISCQLIPSEVGSRYYEILLVKMDWQLSGAMWMGTVEAYEHRGSRYSALEVRSQAQALEVLKMFHDEKDIWLKKILAMKLRGQNELEIEGTNLDLVREALECRINS